MSALQTAFRGRAPFAEYSWEERRIGADAPFPLGSLRLQPGEDNALNGVQGVAGFKSRGPDLSENLVTYILENKRAA